MSSSRLDFIFGIGIVLLVLAMWINHRRSAAVKINSAPELSVQTLIEKVRDGLTKAELERLRKQEDSLLELQGVELEINFVVEEGHKGSGALDLKVTTVGAETSLSSETTQKIKLHLVAAKPPARQEAASTVPLEVDQATILRGEKPTAKE